MQRPVARVRAFAIPEGVDPEPRSAMGAGRSPDGVQGAGAGSAVPRKMAWIHWLRAWLVGGRIVNGVIYSTRLKKSPRPGAATGIRTPISKEDAMGGTKIDLIQQVMGASHVFCTTVGELLERSLAEATDEQLVLSQVKLLLLIGRPGQRFKVTDVAEFLGVTNAAASRAIDRLVQRGLIDRTVSVEDRRAVDLALTDASRELLAEFKRVRDRELLRVLGSHSTEKLLSAAALLDELSIRLAELETEEQERCLRCGIHFRNGCVMRDVLGRECVVSRELYGERDDPGASDEVVAEAS